MRMTPRHPGRAGACLADVRRRRCATRSSACARRTPRCSARLALRRTLRRASVVGCSCSAAGSRVLSLVAIWLRVTLLDTDRYVDTVAPIAAEPAVQGAVAAASSRPRSTRRRLRRAGARGAARPRRRARAGDRARRAVGDLATGSSFTRSPRFQELWVEANRRAHTRVVELLTGGRSNRLVLDDDTVYLDLSPAVDRVKDALKERGLTGSRPRSRRPSTARSSSSSRARSSTRSAASSC